MTTFSKTARPGILFTLSLFIGPAAWLMPHQGVMATLLLQRLAEIDPINKVFLSAVFSSTAMIIALIANIVLGAVSDATRSRFGKRKPWIIGCSVLSCLVLVAFAYTSNLAGLFIWWCLYEVVVNGVASAMVAQMSDRVPQRWRATVSSAYSMGVTVGVQLGALVAAQFLQNVRLGTLVFAAIALFGGVLSALMAGEKSNTDEPRPTGSRAKAFVISMRFPTKGAGDFYKALAARMLQILSTSMASSYMLYIIPDYLGQGQRQTQVLLSVNAIIMLVAGLSMSALIGPVADRFHKVKLFNVIATLAIAVGAYFLFFMPTPTGLILFALITGIAGGANATLSQALSLDVLPNPKAAAKDLGILNLANTLGGVGATLIAAWLISMWGYASIFIAESIGMFAAAACLAAIKVKV